MYLRTHVCMYMYAYTSHVCICMRVSLHTHGDCESVPCSSCKMLCQICGISSLDTQYRILAAWFTTQITHVSSVQVPLNRSYIGRHLLGLRRNPSFPTQRDLTSIGGVQQRGGALPRCKSLLGTCPQDPLTSAVEFVITTYLRHDHYLRFTKLFLPPARTL